MKNDAYTKSLLPDESDHGPPTAGWWKRNGNSVHIGCPKCGFAMDISRFQIRPDGTVFPSIGRNTIGHEKCQWASHIKLEGWRGENRGMAEQWETL